MMNAIEMKITRQAHTGRSQVVMTFDKSKITYSYDYSVGHDQFVMFYAQKFANELNKLGRNIDLTNAKTGITSTGWVIVL